MTGRRIPYSKAELLWIKGHRDLPRAEAHAAFVARFGRTDVSMVNYKALCTRNGWLTGRTGQFSPGNEAHNKGKRMPFNPNSAAHQFRAGRVPHNTRGAGHESVDKDGYTWIIIDAVNPFTGAATRRVMKHRHLWEEANGPVPEGYALKSRDGDRGNCDPTNWTAVPRALLPRLNGRFGRGYDTAPADLKPVIMATAKLEHKAREARK